MAKTKQEALITQSLMDRLSENKELPRTRMASLAMYRETLKREVEWLLNTRQPPVEGLEEYPLAAASVINFGLPDLTNFAGEMGGEHGALTLSLMKTLRTFEPRIRNPRVYLSRTDTLRRSLSFHVEGQIVFETMDEDISFDTVLELLRGEYEVR